jgi:Ni/Co efflux regulator RcnB
MKKTTFVRLAVATTLGVLVLSSQTSARDRWDKERDRRHHHNNHWEDWDNRRDARRAGVIAGAAASGIARSAARSNSRENYEECMTYYSNDRYYDQYCREQYYYDMQSGRRAARRTGVIVGLTTREIVRD